jgi:hypothetical protein
MSANFHMPAECQQIFSCQLNRIFTYQQAVSELPHVSTLQESFHRQLAIAKIDSRAYVAVKGLGESCLGSAQLQTLKSGTFVVRMRSRLKQEDGVVRHTRKCF